MVRKIEFFKKENGRIPIEEFLDSLPDKVVQKIIAVLELVETEVIVPVKFFKKLVNTELWECRIRRESNIYRLLCFFDNKDKVVIATGFIKKTQKTPQQELDRAEKYRREYFSRREE